MRPHPSSLLLAVAVAACSADLPPGTTEFTVGRTVVRTDSMLDVAGVVFSIADTSLVPPRGPVRHWLDALRPQSGDTALVRARELGAAPISAILETWVAPGTPDSACGAVAPGRWLCLTGNAPVQRELRRFLDAARGAYGRLAPLDLDNIHTDARLRDLADVYTALTLGKALDSAVIAYTGYPDLQFDVVLARTLYPTNLTPGLDPARPRGARRTIFVVPDPTFPVRSYRSPNYIWLTLVHQMTHEAVRRLFAERPELLEHGFHLREAAEPEMAVMGYAGVFWDEILGEQLARAITVRIMRATNPTATWAARAEAMNQRMTLVPWFEDALERYEARRDSYPTLAAFAPHFAAALDSIPLDTCRGTPSPQVALAGVALHRAVVAWLGEGSPFRAQRLQVGDTVLTLDGDSVAASELLLPTRQLNVKWAQHLPAELGMMTIRRGGRTYGVQVPIAWVPREAVRVAAMARDTSGTVPICRWITRAVRR